MFCAEPGLFFSAELLNNVSPNIPQIFKIDIEKGQKITAIFQKSYA